MTTYSCCSLMRLASWGGMVPLSWFEERPLRKRQWKNENRQRDRQWTDSTEINWEKIVKENEAVMSVQIWELSEVVELSWDGAVELIRVELPEIETMRDENTENNHVYIIWEILSNTKLWLWTYKFESFVRLPSWGGIVPLSWFNWRNLRER